MKKKIIAGIIIAMLVIGFLSLFPRKVAFQDTITACNYEGETISAEFDVELWKYWYMKNSLKGSVTINGRTYEPVDYEGGADDRYFFAVPVKDATKLHDNMLLIDLYDTDFEYFLLELITEEKYAYAYFGPAETLEEMEKVINAVSGGK